jgi:uncharacterized membrane protein (UPF0127 family)
LHPEQFNNKNNSAIKQSISMSNSSQATPTAPIKKKKKKTATNWKQVLIIGTMAIAGISMVAPGIFGWIGNLFSSGNNYPTPTSEVATTPAPAAETTTTPTTNTDAMPEPVFKKEGELFFQPASGGKAIAKIDIERAETEVERAQGLMFRKSMDEDKGMLFLFERSEPQSFYMRNTYIPLDIMFVDENNVITTIHENTKTLNDNSLPSNGPAKYVVEVNGGYAKRHGIKVGDKISWQ